MGILNTNIKSLREYRKMSQEQFGDKFDLTRGMVASYESHTEPSIHTMMRIAEEFDFDLIEFLSREYVDNDQLKELFDTTSYRPAGGFNKAGGAGGASIGAAPKVVVVDQSNSASIVQLDAKAAAGYPDNVDNPLFFKDLPTMTLPGDEFKNGSFIAIQTAGDSMHPTIYHHDWLIARFNNDWSDIREGYIHVVVTKTGVAVKRLLNRIAQRGSIVLLSDNNSYPTYEEKIEDILQIWDVKGKLSFNLRNENADLRQDLNDLRAQISEINSEVQHLRRAR